MRMRLAICTGMIVNPLRRLSRICSRKIRAILLWAGRLDEWGADQVPQERVELFTVVFLIGFGLQSFQ